MATIVHQGADDTVSEEIDDEKPNYREDHWQIHHGDDEYAYIPRERVYTVKMTDPHFENERGDSPIHEALSATTLRYTTGLRILRLLSGVRDDPRIRHGRSRRTRFRGP